MKNILEEFKNKYFLLKNITEEDIVIISDCVFGRIYTKKRSLELEKNILYSLSRFFYDEALYNFFIEKDIIKTKQSFYLSAIMELYLHLFFNDNDLFIISGYPLSAMLLSDNKKLINMYANITYNGYEKDLKKGHPMPFVQAILKDDWKYLKEKIDFNRENFTSKKSNVWFDYDLDFFEALLNKDIKKMEEAVLLLATKGHRKRNPTIYRKDLVSTPALTYAKLAYIKGFKLDINHPKVPKELLEIKPNNEYWKYDFMKEGEYKNV